jgi:integrase
MASVYLKRQTWYARYKNATGSWVATATTAKTKSEAKRIAEDLERRCERQRLGLEVMPIDSNMTFGQLCEWWLKEWCPAPSLAREQCRLRRHCIEDPLGKVLLKDLTAFQIETKFRDLEKVNPKERRKPHAPASLNKLRATLHSVFRRARKPGFWTRPNPIDDIETKRVPKPVYQTLSAEEVPLVLAQIPLDWRALFATAIYTAMRKGELFGLRKSDVDLAARTITVARSYGRDTTKGGHADMLPIATPLVPFLEWAMRHSPSELMFPDADGKMRKEGADPEKILRTALGRAGIVEGYEHVCRRCKARGQPHSEHHPDAEVRRCPACGMRLWPRAIPRWLRFQDLRHSTGTLLLRCGVDPHRVQRIMRHRDVKLTTSTYAHLIVEDLRDAAERIAPLDPVDSPDSTGSHPNGQGHTPFVTRLLPAEIEAKKKAESAEISLANPASCDEREKGFEPSTPALARRCSTAELFPHLSALGEVPESAGDIAILTGHRQALCAPPPLLASMVRNPRK